VTENQLQYMNQRVTQTNTLFNVTKPRLPGLGRNSSWE